MKLNIGLIIATVTISTCAVKADVVVLGSSDAQNGPISNGSSSINTTTSQSMIGSGAWQANGTSASQYYLYSNATTDTQHGLGQLTIGDLSSLSFSTYGVTPQSPNWYLTIYTTPYTGGEHSWYGNRLVLEPYLANGLTGGANQWNTWSTAAGANQLTINDTGGLSGNIGFYGQPTLADIQAGAINWAALGSPGGSSTSIDYSQMDILGIVLSTGSPWDVGFNGLVDDVQINTPNNGNVTFDLEGASASVPEPSTYIAGMLLLLPFGVSTLRMLRKNRTA